MEETIEYSIRIAKEEDMERALQIYSYYVEHTVVSFEYAVPSLEEFKERYRNIIKKFPYLVVEMDGEIVGYAYANTMKSRAAYNWGVETTIYLDKERCRNGIGSALYLELEKYLARQHILNLYACISYPYPMSVLFHEKLGYQKIGHFRNCGYKFNKWHDMIWMEKLLGEHKENMQPVIWFADL